MVKERFAEWTRPSEPDEPARLPVPTRERNPIVRLLDATRPLRRATPRSHATRVRRAPACVPRRSCPSHERRHGRSEGAPGCATRDNESRVARPAPVRSPVRPAHRPPAGPRLRVVDPEIACGAAASASVAGASASSVPHRCWRWSCSTSLLAAGPARARPRSSDRIRQEQALRTSCAASTRRRGLVARDDHPRARARSAWSHPAGPPTPVEVPEDPAAATAPSTATSSTEADERVKSSLDPAAVTAAPPDPRSPVGRCTARRARRSPSRARRPTGAPVAPATRHHRQPVAPARPLRAAAPRPKSRPTPKAAPKPKLGVVRPAWKPRPNSARCRLVALLVVLVLLFVVVGRPPRRRPGDEPRPLRRPRRSTSDVRTGRARRPSAAASSTATAVTSRCRCRSTTIVGRPARGQRSRPATRRSSRRSLGVDQAELATAARPDRHSAFVYVARKVDDETVDRVAGARPRRRRPRARVEALLPRRVARRAACSASSAPTTTVSAASSTQYEDAAQRRAGQASSVERDPQGREHPRRRAAR